jgi:hypothetical protein
MRFGSIVSYSMVLLAAAGGCSSLDVSVDYDPKVDFSKLRFWAWYPEADQSAEVGGSNPRMSPFTFQRARGAIEQVLGQKGFAQAPLEKSDFLVSVHTTLERHVQVDPYGWGYRWGPYAWGPYWDGYWGPAAVYSYEVLTLIIDIYDAAPSRHLIWRGMVQSPAQYGLSHEEEQERVRNEVNQVLLKFPPNIS